VTTGRSFLWNLTKIAAIVVGLGVLAVIVSGPKSPAVNGSPSAQTISVLQLHATINPDGLPIQRFEDQSLIYPIDAQK
jgi:hypothetical protein